LGAAAECYGPLASLQPEVVAAANNVVLLVIDGLGYHYLRDRSSGFDAHLQGAMTSVFPSSTAPAITTFLTGVAPQQHAVSGWFMNLKELGAVAMILPFCSRLGGISLASAGVQVGDLIGAPSVFDSLSVPAYFVIDAKLRDSPYSRAGAGRAERLGYHRLNDCFTCIADLVGSGSWRKFIYAYWPMFDALAHRYGVGSVRLEAHFRQLEQAFLALVEALRGTDTLLVVTADHGFVDTGPEFGIRLQEHPALQRCLCMPLCGEPRAAFCYVRAGSAGDFEAYVRERLGACCDLYGSEELVDAGWFGVGQPDPRLLQRLGDYVLIMRGRYVIKDALLVEGVWADIGVHGGASEDEMLVPLIVAHC
jgi:hypothetical protein